ncbi:MAG TPA: ATP-binding protein [Stellaceae bacterium]|nr:ATP-binding protein [Stellaceae bacterium]
MSLAETMIMPTEDDNVVHMAFYGVNSIANIADRSPLWDNIATTSVHLVNPRDVRAQKHYPDQNAAICVEPGKNFHRLVQSACLQTIHDLRRSGLVVRLNVTIDGLCPFDHRQNVLIAARAMVANAVKHGFHERTIGEICVTVTSGEMSGTRIETSDDGWGIDFSRMREAAGFQLLRSLGNVAVRDQPGSAGSRRTTVGLLIEAPDGTSLARQHDMHRVSGVSQGDAFVRLLREQCEKIVTDHLARELLVQVDLSVEGCCPTSYRKMVARVVDELVYNAVQHGFKNRPTGRIFVHVVSRRASEIQVSVCDDGCGFDSTLVRDGNGFYLLRQLGYVHFEAPEAPFNPAAAVSVRIPVQSRGA